MGERLKIRSVRYEDEMRDSFDGPQGDYKPITIDFSVSHFTDTVLKAVHEKILRLRPSQRSETDNLFLMASNAFTCASVLGSEDTSEELPYMLERMLFLKQSKKVWISLCAVSNFQTLRAWIQRRAQ